MNEKLKPYSEAVEALRTTLHETREHVANHESTKAELERFDGGRDRLLDDLFRNPAQHGNGEKTKKIQDLNQKHELAAAKLEFLHRQIDLSIQSLQTQIQPLQICLTLLYQELSNHVFMRVHARCADFVHARLREESQDLINQLAMVSEEVIDLRDLQVPSAPFNQSLDNSGFTFPQPRETIIGSTLTSARNLLDAADELLKETQKTEVDGFTPPPYNPKIVEEQEAARHAERTQAIQQALEHSQSLQTASIAQRLAEQAGKKWEDLSDYERQILLRIEQDQLQVTQGRMAIGT